MMRRLLSNIEFRTFLVRHALSKVGSTARILLQLGAARTFGKYEHSGWDGTIHYARYRWRGRDWIIPTGPVTEEELRAETMRVRVPLEMMTSAEFADEFQKRKASMYRAVFEQARRDRLAEEEETKRTQHVEVMLPSGEVVT